MQHYTFPYTEAFHCTAGDCPDSCCKGWEIVIDSKTLQTYQQTCSPIGETIRSTLTKNEDDEWMFQNREDGNCPFWNAEKLCDLQIQAGERLLCDTCRQFPRIPQDYTLFTEHVLSLACPEAARLVLTQTEPFQAIPITQSEPSERSGTPLFLELDELPACNSCRSTAIVSGNKHSACRGSLLRIALCTAVSRLD